MAPRNSVGYVVRLSEPALIGMILNGLEAYSVMHDRRARFVETYGCLFGYQATMLDERTLYQVEMANIDTSAKRKADGVKYYPEAMILKAETMHCYWPHLEYLGDFHTHPYESCSRVRSAPREAGDGSGDSKGYFFSVEDKKSLRHLTKQCRENNIRYRVGLAVAIAALDDLKRKEPAHIHSNCIAFNIKRHRMWITAYCAYENGHSWQYTENRDNTVFLECQSVLGSIESFF
ncbi:hypothetical protein LPW11_20125 [Geomonas sp. RF6]|uniref:hypothetical protein n=1 Tax=Geomonas sp. RF6 TaxID=2897342 RepID=UPI001E48BA7C|nr:hypothetical protein [Geomonas sp. RF6]UFS70168.1 hypothetical protein LPW11_20125 [Geomonas sp. RF6]